MKSQSLQGRLLLFVLMSTISCFIYFNGKFQNTFEGETLSHSFAVLEISNTLKLNINQVTRYLRIFVKKLIDLFFLSTLMAIEEVVNKLWSLFDAERFFSVVLRIEFGLYVCQSSLVAR